MQNQFKNLLVAWNKATGKFNSAAKSPPAINGQKDLATYYPKYKDRRSLSFRRRRKFFRRCSFLRWSFTKSKRKSV
jgi:hypothetical protein